VSIGRSGRRVSWQPRSAISGLGSLQTAQMVRYWGLYANAACGKRRKVALAGDTPQAPCHQDDELTRRAWLSWALFVRRVYEVDPLLCPFCGSEMKILTFLLDFGSAQAIRKSLELPAQEPEPLAHRRTRDLPRRRPHPFRRPRSGLTSNENSSSAALTPLHNPTPRNAEKRFPTQQSPSPLLR